MQKKVVPIKEIDVIEGLLNDAPVGIVAFRNDESIIQKTRSFIYLDKNIYILFNQGEEEFKKIRFGKKISFAVLKNLSSSDNLNHIYKILSVIINGKIRLIDDQKINEEIAKAFIKKYKWKKTEISSSTGWVMIDTEEIQAHEESGG